MASLGSILPFDTITLELIGEFGGSGACGHGNRLLYNTKGM